MLKISDFVLMLCSIKQIAFLDSPGMVINKSKLLVDLSVVIRTKKTSIEANQKSLLSLTK